MLVTGWIAAVLLTAVAGDHLAVNGLFADLRTHGIVVPGAAPVTLPAPTLGDEATADEQQAALGAIVGDRYEVSEFTRDSVVAPFVLKFRDFGAEQVRVRGVDLWFVAYGDLDALARMRAFEKMAVASDKSARLHALTDAELASRGFQRAHDAASEERVIHTDADMLDRAELAHTLRLASTRTEASLLSASRVDDRFAGDAKYPNAYRRLSRDELGKVTRGPWQPYHDAGAYLKATRLAEPPGALLLEYHAIFWEPHDWFDGANLLRSKLPTLMQSKVRWVRRELRKSGEKE